MNKKETSLNILFTYLTIKTHVSLDQVYNILNHNTEISGTFHMLNIIQLKVLKKKKKGKHKARKVNFNIPPKSCKHSVLCPIYECHPTRKLTSFILFLFLSLAVFLSFNMVVTNFKLVSYPSD